MKILDDHFLADAVAELRVDNSDMFEKKHEFIFIDLQAESLGFAVFLDGKASHNLLDRILL